MQKRRKSVPNILLLLLLFYSHNKTSPAVWEGFYIVLLINFFMSDVGRIQNTFSFSKTVARKLSPNRGITNTNPDFTCSFQTFSSVLYVCTYMLSFEKKLKF